MTTLTIKAADKLIEAGLPVWLWDQRNCENFQCIIVRRDRYNIYTAAGGVFDRRDMQVTEQPTGESA